jgi:hydrogenase maturation protease
MHDLRSQLRQILSQRACLLGIGSLDHGDDGFGVPLAQAYAAATANLPDSARASVLIGGNQPESQLSRLPENLDHLVFLDAVDLGAAPGSVVWLDSGEMRARYPQVSTRRLGLGLLAQLVESGSRARAWLLGVQPESLRRGAGLSRAVETTLELLRGLLTERLGPPAAEGQIA